MLVKEITANRDGNENTGKTLAVLLLRQLLSSVETHRLGDVEKKMVGFIREIQILLELKPSG